MKTALVIFNGIRFSYDLAVHVIVWAKKNGGIIHALFVKAKHRENEGYVFPSDIDAAEDLAGTGDIEHRDVLVIRSQIKLFEDMAKTENIPLNSELLTDPSLRDIVAITKGPDILFIDADDTDFGILSVTSFTMKELIKKSLCPVEIIKAKTE
ncbi:MAG: hypothetical protein ACHQFX_05140 [Chitinophagales bacterium]